MIYVGIALPELGTLFASPAEEIRDDDEDVEDAPTAPPHDVETDVAIGDRTGLSVIRHIMRRQELEGDESTSPVCTARLTLGGTAKLIFRVR